MNFFSDGHLYNSIIFRANDNKLKFQVQLTELKPFFSQGVRSASRCRQDGRSLHYLILYLYYTRRHDVRTCLALVLDLLLTHYSQIHSPRSVACVVLVQYACTSAECAHMLCTHTHTRTRTAASHTRFLLKRCTRLRPT